jgi:hypothetical protein
MVLNIDITLLKQKVANECRSIIEFKEPPRQTGLRRQYIADPSETGRGEITIGSDRGRTNKKMQKKPVRLSTFLVPRGAACSPLKNACSDN